MNYNRLIKIYYAVIIFLGLYSTYLVLVRKSSFLMQYQSFMASGVSPMGYLITILSALSFIMSIVFIVIILRNQMPRIHVVCPVYYVFYYAVWSFLTPLVIALIFNPFNSVLELNSFLSKYDVVFYVLNIIIPGYLLFGSTTLKRGNRDGKIRNIHS